MEKKYFIVKLFLRVSLTYKCEKNTFLYCGPTYESQAILIFSRKTFSMYKSNFLL